MSKLLIFALTLLAAAAVAFGGGRAGGRPKLRSFASAAEALASVRLLNHTDRRVLFAQWRAENGKAYASPAREAAAFAAFNATVDGMIAHNSRQGARFFKGLTDTADLTWQQFQAGRLMRPVDAAALAAKPPARAPRRSRKLQQALPAELDWRALGKVTGIKNQGNCGSCWAFSAVAALESKALIDGTPFSGNLSEQQMVDCVNAAAGYGSTGCDGGWPHEVMSYVKAFRATSEADYPYTATAGSACLEPSGSPAAPGSLTVSGHIYQAYTPTRASMQAAVAISPVVIYFRVESSFQSYSGGIYPANSCTSLPINHAMVVVGYNFTAPVPYWIVRNSWGGWWGIDGYAHIEATEGVVDWGTCTMYVTLTQVGRAEAD